ncbi:MAG: deoxynucleoside kinase [archaeon]|nr:deoxynucleoside kinase [archaeon]
MENLRIGICGNIGVGKSTLVEQASTKPLSDFLLDTLPARTNQSKIHVFPEEFNPEVLKAFYKDPVRYALMAQIEFFNGRVERQKLIKEAQGIILEDRTLAEDYHIFGKAQIISGNMNEAEFLAYQRNYRLLAGETSHPDLIVYLKSSVDTTLDRIAKRGREEEKSIPREYLDVLNGLYEEFVKDHVECPVLVIDANEDCDLSNNYFEKIIRRVAEEIKNLNVRITTPGISEWISLPQTRATLKSIKAEKTLQNYLANNPRLITIAGLVGLGKSTLAAILEQSMQIGALYEKPEENPLLEQFLGDKATHAYDLQLHFLKMRSKQRLIGKSGDKSYVKDRSLPEDYLTFSRMLHNQGYLSDDQLDNLSINFRRKCQELPGSDLLILLKGSPELAWQRIVQRGRLAEVEGGWKIEDIRHLARSYENYGKEVKNNGFHNGPVLEIDVGKVDLLNRIHLGYVFDEIYRALNQ